MSIMANQHTTVTRQLKRIIRESDRTLYDICARAEVDLGAASRFMRGKVGFTGATIDKLCRELRIGLKPFDDKD